MTQQPAYCVMIPHYRHVPQLRRWLPDLAATGIDVILVDDGSGPDVVAELADLCAGHPNIELIAQPVNAGKGMASIIGMNTAVERGYSHVVSMDADGQHNPADLQEFIRVSQDNPEALVSGAPQFSDDIPKSRLHGRKITNKLVQLEAGRSSLVDAMCGYRLYPLAATLPLLPKLGSRLYMQFDVELLVRAAWAGLSVRYVPTSVTYPSHGRSHFRLFQDNALLTAMHIRLLIESPVRIGQRFLNNRGKRMRAANTRTRQ
ncbi:MAG: glycosyltransferase family 2 protein [Pseudomonadaceae bacterium]|nr:glycosyltransferase family 2 protein [Pseudomonadaceae bacterium]